MDDELILVDLADRQIGTGEKMWVHASGKLHRAFSVFVVCGDKMLLQRRNPAKYHSGGLWANACCSHPRGGERLEEAVARRLDEELGVRCPVEELFHFVYRSVYENGLCEFEYDHVFLARYCGQVRPCPDEIVETKWIGFDALKAEIVTAPDSFSSWFLIAAPRVLELLEGSAAQPGPIKNAECNRRLPKKAAGD